MGQNFLCRSVMLNKKTTLKLARLFCMRSSKLRKPRSAEWHCLQPRLTARPTDCITEHSLKHFKFHLNYISEHTPFQKSCSITPSNPPKYRTNFSKFNEQVSFLEHHAALKFHPADKIDTLLPKSLRFYLPGRSPQ